MQAARERKNWAQRNADPLHFVTTFLALPIYNYVVLLAIVEGVVSRFYESGAGFFLFLMILPMLFEVVIHLILKKVTGIDLEMLIGFLSLAVMLVLVNTYFLGCHPIWVGRGMCDVSPFVTHEWMRWYGPPGDAPQPPNG